jgi:LacI family transcriptional regulator
MRNFRGTRGRPTIATVTWTLSRLGLEIAKGVSDYARERDWNILRLDNRASLSVAALRKANVQGVVLQAFMDSPIRTLLGLGMPVVNTSNSRLHSALPRVVSDDNAVGRLAADYFLGKGFRNFAFCGSPRSGASILRERGYVERLKEKGHQVSLIRGEFELGVAYFAERTGDELASWLAKLRKPCAIFTWNDGICDTIANFCHQRGWRIPQDISQLGVNNGFQRLVDDDPDSISSIELAGHAIGYQAAQVLGRMMAGGPKPTEPIFLPPLRIVERRSTDFFAVSDPTVLAALRFIKQNCQRPIGVDDIAGAAMLSRRILEKRFRSLLQISPYDDLLRCRLERAKELLLSTNLKLEEIAHLCGYENGSNFSTSFREKVGCCPSLFRLRRSTRFEFTEDFGPGDEPALQPGRPAAPLAR